LASELISNLPYGQSLSHTIRDNSSSLQTFLARYIQKLITVLGKVAFFLSCESVEALVSTKINRYPIFLPKFQTNFAFTDQNDWSRWVCDSISRSDTMEKVDSCLKRIVLISVLWIGHAFASEVAA
jgi:hypothetical protein